MMETTETGADVVERHWPYDGPHDPGTIADALQAAAALLRYACNASQRPAAVGLAPEGYRTLGELQDIAERLPQLLGQLGQWGTQTAADSSLRHDEYRGESAERSAAAAMADARHVAELLRTSAEQHAEGLIEDVLAARGELAHLYHDEE